MKATVLIFVISFFLFSFSNKYTNSDDNLFKIERSKDANQIYYDVQTIPSGELNHETPINIYWIKKTDGNKVKPLTLIQQKWAYGVDYTFKNDSLAQFHFVSYNKRDFILKKDSDNKFKVFTKIDNHYVEVKRIYIYITGGTFWFPKIPKIELYVYDKILKQTIIEVINPY